MSSAEYLQILGSLAAAFGSIVAAIERRFVKRLTKASADSRENAMDIHRMHRLTRWRAQRLVAAGVVHQTEKHRWFIDTPAYRALRTRRRKRTLTAATLVVAAIVLFLILTR